MTGIINQIHAELASFSQRQIDSVIASPHTLKKDKRLFKSREEYKFTLENTGLILASDKALTEYFNKNKNAFEALKDKLT